MVGMRTLRAVVDCVPKGGPRFFNVIRGDGKFGEFAVHRRLKFILSLSVFQFCHMQSLGDSFDRLI